MRRFPAAGAAFIVFLAVGLPAAAEPRPAEAFINEYIDHLCYMVYISEQVKIEPGEEYVYRKAVSVANDYLAARKMKVVLLDQVEKLKKDHATLVEDAQGENMSVAQWLAQKLNADVYIQMDVMVKSQKRGVQYYAQANVSCQVFDASVAGELFGAKSYTQLDRSVGSSEELAKSNAVQIAVTRIMNDVIRLAQDKMREAVERGIRYELYLMKTQDARAVLEFVDRLKAAVLDTGAPAVTGVESVFRTDSEAKYYVHFYGKPEQFELLVRKTAETIPGLGGLKLVAQRGKSFTFTTGME